MGGCRVKKANRHRLKRKKICRVPRKRSCCKPVIKAKSCVHIKIARREVQRLRRLLQLIDILIPLVLMNRDPEALQKLRRALSNLNNLLQKLCPGAFEQSIRLALLEILLAELLVNPMITISI